MEVKAQAKFQRIAPRKTRLVVGLLKNISVADARNQLSVLPKRAAHTVLKVLNSAVANATNNHKLSADDLVVARAYVDEGPTLKRWMPRAFGRASQIMKRTSHITIVVAERTGALDGAHKKKKKRVRTVRPRQAAKAEAKVKTEAKA